MNAPTIALNLAQKVKKLGDKQELTRKRVAERANMPLRYYQKLESKNPHAVRITTLKKTRRSV